MKVQKAKYILRSERGETMVAYVLLVVLIALVCIPSAKGVASGIGKSACSYVWDSSESRGEWDRGHCWWASQSQMHQYDWFFF